MGMTLGERIKESREKKGISQKELARLIGCSPSTITEWEKLKDRIPTKKLLDLVSEVLEIPIDYLLVGLKEVENNKIPCYNEISSEEFIWQENEIQSYVKISENGIGNHSRKRFSIKINGDFFEPIMSKEDYGIFEKQEPKDGDIVIVRFLESNKALIRMWRQQSQYVMLSEINLEKLKSPYFFEFELPPSESTIYTTKNKPKQKIAVEGKLLYIKKNPKKNRNYLGIKYIYS